MSRTPVSLNHFFLFTADSFQANLILISNCISDFQRGGLFPLARPPKSLIAPSVPGLAGSCLHTNVLQPHTFFQLPLTPSLHPTSKFQKKISLLSHFIFSPSPL